jgi:LPXTG-motif cell wall-anchored protein
VVTDPLPAGLTLTAADGNGWQCSANGQTVRCEHAGPLAAGADAALRIRTGVAAADGTRIENVASVSGGHTSDPSAVAGLTVGRPQGSGGTASTGVPTAQLLEWAGLLLLAGGIALLLARRRRTG